MASDSGAVDNSLDLAATDPVSRKPDLPDATNLTTEPYNPLRDQEKTRGWIALLMIGLLILVAAGLIAGIFVKATTPDDVAKLASAILAPIVGLVGTVLGFYFGQNTRR